MSLFLFRESPKRDVSTAPPTPRGPRGGRREPCDKCALRPGLFEMFDGSQVCSVCLGLNK